MKIFDTWKFWEIFPRQNFATLKVFHVKISRELFFHVKYLAMWKILPRELFCHLKNFSTWNIFPLKILPREKFGHVWNNATYKILPREKFLPRENFAMWIILVSEKFCQKLTRKGNNGMRGSDWTSMRIACICFQHVVIKFNFINKPMVAKLTMHESF